MPTTQSTWTVKASQRAVKSPRVRAMSARELQHYLPRRSFFSCHDKALKEAGYPLFQAWNNALSKHRNIHVSPRTSAQNSAQSRHHNHVLSDERAPSSDQTKTPNAHVYSGILNNAKSRTRNVHVVIDPITQTRQPTSSAFPDLAWTIEDEDRAQISETDNNHPSVELYVAKDDIDSDSASAAGACSDKCSDVSPDSVAGHMISHRMSKQSIRRQESKYTHLSNSVLVDHKPILEYLIQVQNNPSEYLSSRPKHGNTTGNVTVTRSLIREAEVYRLGQYDLGPNESLISRAAYEIRQRPTNPSTRNISSEYRTLPLTSTLTRAKMAFRIAGINIKKNVQENAKSSETNPEEYLTDLEKSRLCVEKWLKTVTSAQLHTAREEALCELGESELSLSHWWTCHSSCRYLRPILHSDYNTELRLASTGT